MSDVREFNEKYLMALMEIAVSSKHEAASLLNADLSQISEIAKTSLAIMKAISDSSVAVVDSTFSLNDLKRRTPINASEVVATSNHLYLTMIRHLATKDVRLAMLATRTSEEGCEMLKEMTVQDIQAVAKSNTLMFRCTIAAKAVYKANMAAKSLSTGSGAQHYLNHIPLMSLRNLSGYGS